MDSNRSVSPLHADDSGAPDAVLACNCCRKRKLRCSREIPACQHCRKTGNDCIYERKKGKPGMKAGAIENVHRRLDALEQTVARQQKALDHYQSQEFENRGTVPSIISLLAEEVQNLNKQAHNPTKTNKDQRNHQVQISWTTKRRRLDEDLNVQGRVHVPSLPEDEILNQVLRLYFSHVHPWIPVLHEHRFRRRLTENSEKAKLNLVLHSMTFVALRYIDEEGLARILTRSPGEAEIIRDWIISQAMKEMSVENLQVLVMIAFDDIGNGEATKAWPLVGSLSCTVEYLQLTVEDDEVERPSFSQPYMTLAPAKDWTEAEERRRVFWNVFNLDRFCSVSMGWNTSLTSDDVNRRLPCDGITWRKEEPVITPYFGIWDKSAGRIGNPIAFLPTHPILPTNNTNEEGHTPSETGTSPAALSTVDMSTVGAFAYCIEATESLSRVTSYFLQQKVNIKDQRDLSSWLTRFKELDLRLVHWKMLLPQKWKVNMHQPSRMDPNLTLAHVTHNASMILLHQPIAFPPLDWPFRTRLPSLCSIDTCQAAAVEISTITDHYLNNAPVTTPLSSQFAFCLYIAARVLLLHWRYSLEGELDGEFWLLVKSLDLMSKRWTGCYQQRHARVDLAAKYSSKLVQLHRCCIESESFTIIVPGYTAEVQHSNTDGIATVDMGTSETSYRYTNRKSTGENLPRQQQAPIESSIAGIGDVARRQTNQSLCTQTVLSG